MFTIIANPRSTHQVQHQKSLEEGLKSLGIDSVLTLDHIPKTKYVSCWGWRKGKTLNEQGHDVLVMERGYIGDRFKYTSLGWNGLNGHATFPEYPDDKGERFRNHGGYIKPWKKDGKYILVLGQVKNDASLQAKDISSWYKETALKAQEIHGLPVYFRPHPEAQRRGGYTHIDGFDNISGTLEQCLENAKFTIAFNSNSCLDSIVNGVPCFAGDKGTMVYDLCMKDISEIIYPKREETLYQIAWKQWTLDEISSGEPLRKIIEIKA